MEVGLELISENEDEKKRKENPSVVSLNSKCFSVATNDPSVNVWNPSSDCLRCSSEGQTSVL